jgi:hypothetical protein
MGPAKSKDFGTAVGPVVVTADELLPQLDDLHVEVRVNDEIVATGSTRGMRHSVADVVAYASAGEPVQADGWSEAGRRRARRARQALQRGGGRPDLPVVAPRHRRRAGALRGHPRVGLEQDQVDPAAAGPARRRR